MSTDASATPAEATSRRSTLTGVAFALAAAISYGSAQVITRQSLGDLAPPLVGSVIALFWGTLGFSLLSARNLGARGEHLWRGVAFFATGGVFSAIGVLLMFFALGRGQVVVISPVLATNPLFTLFFAAILLRGVERITPRILVGALLVVSGVTVLSVF